MRSRPTWATQQFPGQPGLLSETLSEQNDASDQGQASGLLGLHFSCA